MNINTIFTNKKIELRFFLCAILVTTLGILPLSVFSQKRNVKVSSKSTVEETKPKTNQRKLTKADYKNMPKSMNLPADQGPDEYVQGILWQGNPGISKTVDELMKEEQVYQSQLTSEERTREFRPKNERNEEKVNPIVDDKNAPKLKYDINGGWVNPKERKPVVKQTTSSLFGPLNPQTIPLTFGGPVINGYIPPDTNGDVGPSDVLMTSNGTIATYTRAGGAGAFSVSDVTFWGSVLIGAADAPCDHHVRYDRLAKRWFVIAIGCGTAQPNKIAIAVSSGPTITGTSSFTFYAFVNDTVGTTPNADTGGFADYPTLGVDKNALYIGDNVFNPGFTGSSVFIVNKANLIAGTLTVTAFRALASVYTPQGVDNEDPSGEVGFFVSADSGFYNRLHVRRVLTPGGVPSISGNTQLTITSGAGKNIPATNGSLDSNDRRPFAAMINVNRVLTSARQDVASLWTACSFSMSITSPFNPSTTGSSIMGSRWYEINTDPATPALRQSGTMIDTTGTNYLWIPSNAMSGQGFMAIGSSNGGSGINPGTVVAGRLREDSPSGADALGVTQARSTAFAGQAAYANQTGTGRRWGDYSQTIVDPNDDQTMWTFQEYSNASGNWQERAIKLQAPPPCTPNSCAVTVPIDGLGNYQGVSTITATSTAGSECYDGNVVDWSGFRNYSSYADAVGTPVVYTHGGGPGFHGPGGINAAGNGHLMSVSGAASTGTGTAAVQPFAPNAPGNSTIYLSPTSFKIKLNVTGATAGSKFPLTVTNPDGQVVTKTDAICVLAPTAAAGFIQGRVVDSTGRSIYRANVSLVNTNTNQTYRVSTNPFGYFTINDLPVGDMYVLTVNSKRYTFNPMSFTLNEDLQGIVLSANP